MIPPKKVKVHTSRDTLTTIVLTNKVKISNSNRNQVIPSKKAKVHTSRDTMTTVSKKMRVTTMIRIKDAIAIAILRHLGNVQSNYAFVYVVHC
jgi:UV DNA damage repair endonuclease